MTKSDKRYKCPNCKSAIYVTRAEFINGIAMVLCTDCGKNSFTVEGTLLYL